MRPDVHALASMEPALVVLIVTDALYGAQHKVEFARGMDSLCEVGGAVRPGDIEIWSKIIGSK